MALLGFVVIAWLVVVGAVLMWSYREQLRRCWREPMLKRPVLIIESDDWGAGPSIQAARLKEIAARLALFRDQEGNPPVMTLGVILATADGEKIEGDDFSEYHRIDLGAPQFQALVSTMQAGVAKGVFSLQLHGMEHYWPATLLTLSRKSEPLRAWLRQSPESWTEDLPSHVQSRWCDAASLPSTPLREESIRDAVQAEVSLYTDIFGASPHVVVPPTFVWNEQVEQAWTRAGVKVIVTPGRRFESRSVKGKPATGKLVAINNGDVAVCGADYVVRDAYFEPTLGHQAEKVIAYLKRGARLGRPTLLETHRFNFVRDEQGAHHGLETMTQAIELALQNFPQIRFLSTETLTVEISARNPALIEHRVGPRLAILLARLREISRLRKLALWSGVAIPAWTLYSVLSWTYSEEVS